MSGVDPLKDQHDAGAREPQLDDRPAAERSTESPNRSSSTGVGQPGSHRGRQLARPAAYRFGPANLGRIAPRPRPEAHDNANADVSKIKPKVESTGSAPPRSRNDSGATVEGDGRRRRIEIRTTPPGRPNSIARSTATAAPARQSPKRRARVPDKRQSCDARNAVRRPNLQSAGRGRANATTVRAAPPTSPATRRRGPSRPKTTATREGPAHVASESAGRKWRTAIRFQTRKWAATGYARTGRSGRQSHSHSASRVQARKRTVGTPTGRGRRTTIESLNRVRQIVSDENADTMSNDELLDACIDLAASREPTAAEREARSHDDQPAAADRRVGGAGLPQRCAARHGARGDRALRGRVRFRRARRGSPAVKNVNARSRTRSVVADARGRYALPPAHPAGARRRRDDRPGRQRVRGRERAHVRCRVRRDRAVSRSAPSPASAYRSAATRCRSATRTPRCTSAPTTCARPGARRRFDAEARWTEPDGLEDGGIRHVRRPQRRSAAPGCG